MNQGKNNRNFFYKITFGLQINTLPFIFKQIKIPLSKVLGLSC